MKILIASTKELCYFSGSFFLDRIQEELERKNVEVVRLDFDENEADYSMLEAQLGKTYDAILDMNSRLPYLIDDSGQRVLNEIDAPFINYILDHPLYHHPGLCFPIRRYYTIGIDRIHGEYMKKYYPHLAGTFVLPMSGTKALEELEFPMRKKEILFMGTYLPDEELDDKVRALRNQINDPTYQLALNLWDAWKDTTKPIEECLLSILKGYSGCNRDEDIDEYIRDYYEMSGFPELLNHMFLVDQKKRNKKRESVLAHLAEGAYPVAVAGEGWENSSVRNLSGLHFLPSCPMAASFELMGRYQFVLDINPMFACGLHDRVTSALSNGAVCITDMALEFDSELRDGVNVIFYSEKQLSDLNHRLERYSEMQLFDIAEKGRALAERKYTWSVHAEKLIAYIEGIKESEKNKMK